MKTRKSRETENKDWWMRETKNERYEKENEGIEKMKNKRHKNIKRNGNTRNRERRIRKQESREKQKIKNDG